MSWFQLLVLLIAIVGIILPYLLYISSKIDSLQKSIYEEMKNFHGRLCAIEERRK